MAQNDISEDISFAAPEDDEMEFDEAVVAPVESSDLKPRVISNVASENTEPEVPISKVVATDDDMKKLRNLFGIQLDLDLDAKKSENHRLNAIHIRGVQEMDSNEVLEYFKLYDPASLEWVNDLSCNVVFDNARAAATALIGVMEAFIDAKSSPDETKKELDGIKTIDSNSLEVPVPPDFWVQGKQHHKSKALLLRFATFSDKKKEGAGKYSEFYRKHGNPHYGGKKNLISKSLSEKLARNPNALEEGLPEDEEVPPIEIEEDMDNIDSLARKKTLRMRMRADEEEEKIRGMDGDILISISNEDVNLGEEPLDLESEDVRAPKKSIWERLGNGSRPRSGRREDIRGLSSQSRSISRRPKYSDEDRTSVWSRLSLVSDTRDRPSYEPAKSRKIVSSNLRIKK